MPMIIDVLRSRAQSAEATALDTIAAAARAVAAGNTADVSAVEQALAVVGKEADDFDKAVALARRRAEWLVAADKITSARSRATKLENALLAEGERFIAARDAYAEKAQVLQFDLDEANQAVRDGTFGRDRLLDPINVPGGLRADYAAAVTASRQGEAECNDAEEALKRIETRLTSVANWIERISDQKAEDIDPSTWKAPEGSPEWHRDGHFGELEKKLKEWREIGRLKSKTRETLAATTAQYAAAKKRRDAMIQEILKS